MDESVDQVCRENRHNRLSRDEGERLAKYYGYFKKTKYLNLLLEWLEISTSSFDFIVKRNCDGYLSSAINSLMSSIDMSQSTTLGYWHS